MTARVLTENGNATKAFDWRREILIRELGPKYTKEALLLAMGDADLHDIVTSFERGCTVRMLVRIYS